MKKNLPFKQIKTYLEVLMFVVLALCVFVSGYFFISDPQTAIWELTNRDKVKALKQAYEEVLEDSTIVLLQK